MLKRLPKYRVKINTETNSGLFMHCFLLCVMLWRPKWYLLTYMFVIKVISSKSLHIILDKTVWKHGGDSHCMKTIQEYHVFGVSGQIYNLALKYVT